MRDQEEFFQKVFGKSGISGDWEVQLHGSRNSDYKYYKDHWIKYSSHSLKRILALQKKNSAEHHSILPYWHCNS